MASGLIMTDIDIAASVTTNAILGAAGGESRLLGAHMPTPGGLHKALTVGKAIGCSAVQLFTSSPRQWKAPPLKTEEIDAFYKAREETGIEALVAHDSYLINLAAPSDEILVKSQ